MNDLERFDADDEVVKEGFSVTDLGAAEWCLTTKGRAQAEIERFTAMAAKLKADYCARIDARLAEIVGPHYRTLEAMTEYLRPWATLEVAKAGGKKSVKLLGGTVGFRQAPAHLEVIDEAAAVGWLQGHNADGLVRVKYEVKKAEVKKLIETTGEVPDGCELKAGEVRFYAEPDLPALESKPATIIGG